MPLHRVAVALALVAALAGCAGGGSGSPEQSGPASAGSTGAGTTGPGATTDAESAPCGAQDFLPVLQAALDDAAAEIQIVRVRVERCRSGYAQVFAVPDQSLCAVGAGDCFETEQVLLRWKDDAWRVVTSGTGISCGEGNETLRLIVRVCRGLGYPDLAAPVFRTPSGNIGCALTGDVLRCDILSGLVPAPGPCELDWVGLVLPAEGPAAPNCAGDTAYDQEAPVLSYGGTWQSGAFTCTSRTAGLTCSSGNGHGFTLARAGWTQS